MKTFKWLIVGVCACSFAFAGGALEDKSRIFLTAGRSTSTHLLEICNVGLSYQTTINKSNFFQSKALGVRGLIFIPEHCDDFDDLDYDLDDDDLDDFLFRLDFAALHYFKEDLYTKSSIRKYFGLGVSTFISPLSIYIIPVPYINFGFDYNPSEAVVTRLEAEFNFGYNLADFATCCFINRTYCPVLCLTVGVGF